MSGDGGSPGIPGQHGWAQGQDARARGTAVDDDFAVRLGDLARSLQGEVDVQGTLDAVVDAAVGIVPGAQHASISAIRRRREVITLASTSDLARAIDQAQYDTAQGPCRDALFEQRTVRLPDLDADRRWPDFTARARALGAGSMLVFQLFIDGDSGDLGALNLASEHVDAFDEESEHIGLLFAAHAAVAMADAQQSAQLRTAVDHRDAIGMAKGVLMERYKITPGQAFQVLTRASQQGNRKLVEVADDVVRTGQVPGR